MLRELNVIYEEDNKMIECCQCNSCGEFFPYEWTEYLDECPLCGMIIKKVIRKDEDKDA